MCSYRGAHILYLVPCKIKPCWSCKRRATSPGHQTKQDLALMTTVLLAQLGRSTWVCNLNIIYFRVVKHTRWEVQRLPSDLFPDFFFLITVKVCIKILPGWHHPLATVLMAMAKPLKTLGDCSGFPLTQCTVSSPLPMSPSFASIYWTGISEQPRVLFLWTPVFIGAGHPTGYGPDLSRQSKHMQYFKEYLFALMQSTNKQQ